MNEDSQSVITLISPLEGNGWSSARLEPDDPRISSLPFQLVWRNSNDGMRLTDADGRIVMVNEAFCRMVEMPAEELVGQPFSVVYRVAERERLLAVGIGRFAERAIEPRLERNLVLWNGRRIWFEASNSFVEEEGRPPLLLSIFRDITDRKRAEDELRDARDFSDNLITNAPVLIIRLDRFGRVKSLNHAAEQISGYRLSDLKNRNWARRLVPRRQFPDVWAAFTRRREQHGKAPFYAPLLTRTGEERVIRWNESEVWEHDRVVGMIAFGMDVTEARSNARSLQRYRLLLQHSSDIMLLIGSDGQILEANEAAAQAYGYTREELMAMNARALFAPDTAPDALMHARPEGLTQTVHRRRGDMVFPVEVSSRAARIGDEDVTLWVIRDITERRAAEIELERQAFHDPLTGLANRALFMDRLAHALAGAARRRDNAAIIFVDLDRFKLINDNLGHDAGDELLVAVARRLLGSLRAEDTAARFGGDEFTILLENIADEDEAVRVADRILERLMAPFRVAGREVYVTASIGIACSHGEGHAPEDLLKSADLAMYQVKQRGRAGRTIFTPAIAPQATDQIDLEADLRVAIGRNELHLHYQPIIHMGTGALVGAEALVRWQHPRHGLMLPGEFVPIQEQIGLSDALTAWALGEAVRRRAEWAAEGRDLYVSVNLCEAHLMDEDFAEKVRAVLQENGASPGGVRLEFAEATLMPDPALALEILRGLDALGVELALDNFGAGYSSLCFLRDLPVRAVKIDRSLVASLQTTGDDTVVRAATDLARILGRQVIAEGVETAAAWKTLKGIGCHSAQGFYIAAALPPEQFARWEPPRDVPDAV